jgi:hypothetical protein
VLRDREHVGDLDIEGEDNAIEIAEKMAVGSVTVRRKADLVGNGGSLPIPFRKIHFCMPEPKIDTSE